MASAWQCAPANLNTPSQERKEKKERKGIRKELRKNAKNKEYIYIYVPRAAKLRGDDAEAYVTWKFKARFYHSLAPGKGHSKIHPT